MNTQFSPAPTASAVGLAQILEDYLVGLEDGTAPSEEELLARHSDQAVPLKECLASLAYIQRARVKPAVPGTDGPGPVAGAEPTIGTLGDFRLVREIARGGMGIVYEAVQGSLGRQVALKVLPFAATLDPKQLQRFRNEAQAAAHLHHTNIVPVYAVGCERGVHYYAMQYIAGQTLAAMIHALRQQAGKVACAAEASALPTTELRHEPAQEIPVANSTRKLELAAAPSTQRPAATAVPTGRSDPDFFRTVALLGIQAAEALEHAHQVGILHRDIKPGNLLVDDAGHLWITDFGLAHLPGDANLTGTGDVVGTLRYMSPEQALAQRGSVDHRTDIYSLGVTLRELMTLEPAFSGTDRQELFRQIASEEPWPPRRLNPAIPMELETIVLKAMDKAPADRYQTAQELAADLGRFLKDEPILGRRPSMTQRLRKWARRNRAVVCTGMIAAAVLLITLTIGSSVAAFRLNEAWKAADDKAEELVRQAEHKDADLKRLNEANSLVQSGRYFASFGQFAEAHDAFTRAIKLRPDHSLLCFERADFYIRMGLWELAAADYKTGFQLQEPLTPHPWATHALLSQYMGDEKTYRDLCRRMPQRFALGPEYFHFGNELARSSCLAPVPAEDRLWVIGTAKKAFAWKPHGAWNYTALALAHYRNDDFAQAETKAKQGLDAFPNFLQGASYNLVLALTQHHSGETAKARQALQASERVMENWTQSMTKRSPGTLPVFWYDLLECRILHREAKILIDGQKPPEDSRMWTARGQALQAIGHQVEAAACFAHAPKEAPLPSPKSVNFKNLGKLRTRDANGPGPPP
jgi:serine/threonine protein kinase